MGKMGKFSLSDMKKFQKQLNKLQKENINAFIESCAKELAARLLAILIDNTQPGHYSEVVEFDAKIPQKHVEFDTKDGKHVSFTAKARTKHVMFNSKKNAGKQGGTLRRGWTIQSNIKHEGDLYTIEIINPVEYASYVEYGHRTANHKGWVLGKFIMTKAELQMQEIAPAIIENKVKKFLEECIK